MKKTTALQLGAMIALAPLSPAAWAQAQPPQPRNIVFILSDDHRYDFMGFHPGAPEFLRTPALDRLASEGAHVRNAFVTTSLCSPSRASILTGQYSFKHGVVDNSRPIRKDAVFFPELLRNAGYRTAFIGKWHMGGDSDAPQKGFDRWVSFQGQGVYYDPQLNVDGERKQVKGYITDILTDHALAFIEKQDAKTPFFLYLSHKAVHAEFHPAARHRGAHKDAQLKYPVTMADTERNYRDKPKWVRQQRFGWHGVDYMYHGDFDFDTFYRRYTETLLAVDESVARVVAQLEKRGFAKNTLVVYMGDNGFSFGEHGLIDKRHAYEESMRVPMLAWAPGLIPPKTTLDPMVLNVDVAPTLLDCAGVAAPESMDGRSFLPMLEGKNVPGWRNSFVYTYYWEFNYPHTPTVYALRDAQYKYIFYHGLWDRNELYDLGSDPIERVNLIDNPSEKARVEEMHTRLFDFLESAGAVDVKFQRPLHGQQDERKLHAE